VAILVFLKTMASYNPTSLTPSPFTEVPVLSQESERSCICVLVISNLPISTIFLIEKKMIIYYTGSMCIVLDKS
jgi:hypothetical protein